MADAGSSCKGYISNVELRRQNSCHYHTVQHVPRLTKLKTRHRRIAPKTRHIPHSRHRFSAPSRKDVVNQCLEFGHIHTLFHSTKQKQKQKQTNTFGVLISCGQFWSLYLAIATAAARAALPSPSIVCSIFVCSKIVAVLRFKRNVFSLYNILFILFYSLLARKYFS